MKTLRESILENISRRAMTVDKLLACKEIAAHTKHPERIGNVLRSLQKYGAARLNEYGEWEAPKPKPKRAETESAILFLERLAENFSGISADVLKVRDLLRDKV